MRLSRKTTLPTTSSPLAIRRALEAAGWVCSPEMPSHHVLAAEALRSMCGRAWLPFTNYRLSRVFGASPLTTSEIMGISSAYRNAYGDVATSRWAVTRSDAEISAFAEQVAPLRVPTPKQLWLLYGVISNLGFWNERQSADIMWPYLKRVLHAQRERPMSTRHVKHDLFDAEYLHVSARIMRHGSVRANFELPTPMEPIQCFYAGRFRVERNGMFPPLKDFVREVGHDFHPQVEVNLRPNARTELAPETRIRGAYTGTNPGLTIN